MGSAFPVNLLRDDLRVSLAVDVQKEDSLRRIEDIEFRNQTDFIGDEDSSNYGQNAAFHR